MKRRNITDNQNSKNYIRSMTVQRLCSILLFTFLQEIFLLLAMIKGCI